MCEVISRERPGTGPAAVPSSTTLVPFASFKTAWACCGVQRGPSVCAVLGPTVAASVGVAKRPVSRLRRERPNSVDVFGTASLPGFRCCGRLLLDVVEVARYRPFDDRTIRRNGSCWHFCDFPTDGDDVSS